MAALTFTETFKQQASHHLVSIVALQSLRADVLFSIVQHMNYHVPITSFKPGTNRTAGLNIPHRT